MTIDERLEKLVERHGALTQTVELMAREMADMKSSIEGMKSGIEGMKSGIEGLKSSIDGVRSYTREIAEPTARLLHIAQILSTGSPGSREGSSSAKQ